MDPKCYGGRWSITNAARQLDIFRDQNKRLDSRKATSCH